MKRVLVLEAKNTRFSMSVEAKSTRNQNETFR